MTDEEKAEKKAAKEKAKAERKAKGETVWSDFKKFIARGNVLDMSVGVIMGGAFNAIVTAFTNILLSICTWGVPGGLKGLVTVLPAVNAAQAGMDPANGLDQYFAASELQSLATKEANATYTEATVKETPTLIENMKTTILSKYTLHGTTYTYNMSAVIDWGTFINAIISFLIIALTLFVIVKVFNSVHASRLQFEKQLQEKIKAKEAEKASSGDEAK
ncbi:MAG: MscL family protein [Eubacteriales bacterium]|nr:MscL family protein [Eubacteriales bacterium]